MAFQVVRKKRYVARLVSILEYLETEYGHATAVKFYDLVERKERILVEYPLLGPFTGIRDTRSIYITQHNRLFYRVVGKRIVLLNLYDTRKKNYRQPQ